MKIDGNIVEFCCSVLRDATLIGDISVTRIFDHNRDDGVAEIVIKSVVSRPCGYGVPMNVDMCFDYCPFCGRVLDTPSQFYAKIEKGFSQCGATRSTSTSGHAPKRN